MAGMAPLSGVRFHATYTFADAASAAARAHDLCVEQTIEFPEDLVTEARIRTGIVGRVEKVRPRADGRGEAVVSFAAEVAGEDLPQLLTVLFGNISLLPGIRLERFELPESMLAGYAGPRFGRAGLRSLLCAPARPLLCSALKPMGLPAVELARMAGRLAAGGMDLIKDDHGIADQPFSRFAERVERVCAAVRAAAARSGTRCLYLPNVSGPADAVRARAMLAKQAGAGGLLLAPGVVGWDTMRALADDDQLALPIVAHPALLGSFVVHPGEGISHFVLFGQLPRLAGADAVIFPSFGGRFSFSQEDCRSLAEGTAVGMGQVRPSFPAPAGGMSLDAVPRMRSFYGDDVVLLIGGDLHRGRDLTATCRRFRALVQT